MKIKSSPQRLKYSGSSESGLSSEVVLDRDNFQDRTEEADLVFIMFQADWCRHCKPLAITWEILATKYRSEEALLASVDCDAADNVNKELCSRLGVRGVPSI